MKLELTQAKPEDCDQGHSFLQSGFWGSFKAEFGWQPRYYMLHFTDGSGQPKESPLLVLERRLFSGITFAYIPHGPDCDVEELELASFLAELGRKLKSLLPKTCIFIRFDPPWYHLAEICPTDSASETTRDEEKRGEDSKLKLQYSSEYEPPRPVLGLPLIRARANVQPPDTVFLDLRPSESILLATMKPKWRYNVRLAEKKGVVVEELKEEACLSGVPEFYSLYESTSARDRIAIHPESYYMRLFSLALGYNPGAGFKPDLRLWIARHESEALAAIITIFHGEEAVYLYGASSNEKRNLMPAYALQWAAIKAAKAAGCIRYDFFGIPPTDDGNHPMAGLYRFKTGFGGAIAHRAGSWDFPLRGTAYLGFRAAEAVRTWWFKDFKKRFLKRGD